MGNRQKPGYWAVIPAAVRYDAGLPPNAKLLYAEISALCDAEGYCFAGNAYFVSCFEWTDRSVQRLLKALEEAGYIHTDVIRNPETNEVQERRIYAGINPARTCVPLPTILSGGPDKKDGTPSRQNCRVEQYNKDLNNTPLPPKGGKGKKSKLTDEVKGMLNDYVRGDRALGEAMVAFIEIRTAKGAVNSARAIKTLLKELDRLSGGNRSLKLRLVEQSVANSWKSVFPLKGGFLAEGEGKPQGDTQVRSDLPIW